MGYNSTAATLTLTAKLTPIGRVKLVSNNNALITSFSLGDSDANYNASNTLTTGQIPSLGGNIGTNNSSGNSTTQNVGIKSYLFLDSIGTRFKPVETQSIQILSNVIYNGQNTITGSNITQNVVNRNNFATDSLVNLYYSFGLPLNSTQDSNFTGLTYSQGGYSDTALSGLAQSNILVLGINDNSYGELIDGKQLKVVISTSSTTYTLYSTYQNNGAALKTLDSNLTDTASQTAFLGPNVALMFSDNIVKPNGGNSALTWSTGYAITKPFLLGQKQLYNLQTNSNLALTADTPVAIAYLDKGFVVITHPTIVNAANSITGISMTFNSVSTSVCQTITCIADRGEFGSSSNPTFNGAIDTPRISEVGLYDNTGTLIAIAKTDRQVTKNINQFIALGVQISL